MSHPKLIRHAITLSVLLGLLLALGCQDYDIEVVLEPDGSGRRSIALSVDGKLAADSDPSLSDYTAYFGLDEGSGWRRVEQDQGGKGQKHERADVTRFARDVRIDGYEDWSRQSEDIRLLGTLEKDSHPDVIFSNKIEVFFSGENDGQNLSYREVFSWHDLMSTLVALQTERYNTLLLAAFPDLAPVLLAEMRGLASGAFVMDTQLQIMNADDEEREKLRDTFAEMALSLLQDKHPNAKRESIDELMRLMIIDPEGETDQILEEELPGVELGFFTSIDLSVTMPGPIMETNADSVDGNTASWSFEITDAVMQPVEIFVRSELPD